MIKCVAFDFDGTLVDSNHIKRQAFFDVVAHLPGAPELMGGVLAQAPGDRFQIFERFAAVWHRHTGSEAAAIDAAALTADYTKRCEDAIAAEAEFPGATRALEAIAEKGLATALVSATPTTPLEALVRRKRWRDLFGHVIGGATDKAAALSELARRTRLPAAAILMVGDKQVDQDGARRCGCRFVGMRRGDNDFVVAPPMLVDDYGELLALIDSLGVPAL